MQPSQLIYPNGELQPAMFPDRDIEANIQTWLTEATAKTSGEDAQRHWVYYRAFSTVATRLALTPTSETGFSGDASRTIGKERLDFFQTQANAHLNEYNRLVEAESFLDSKMAKVRIL